MRGYGAPERVLATLPITMSGSATTEGQTGKIELVVSAQAHRTQLWLAGIFAADGVDGNGAWTFEGGSGVAERLSGVEAIEPALDAWLLRRSYAYAFDPARDTSRCENVGDGSARVDLAFAHPELGMPVLSFDLETGALLSVAHTQADGKETRITYEAWSDADRGIRWPRKITDHPAIGNATRREYGPPSHGLVCARFDANGVAIPQQGPGCVDPPPDRFTLRFPADAPPRVRLPLTYLGSELLVRAKLGGREVHAFLDSGAGATAVDGTTPAGAELHSGLELDGAGSTQKVRFGFGVLSAIDLGPLHAEHVPAVSAPIPALDAFGDKRPELILGYSFFASAVIRVDYKHGEVVFARSTDGLFAKGSERRALPLRILKSKIVVDGTVEGVAAPFEVDTGDGGGLDLYKSWAAAHGMPGNRPVATMKGRFGVGAGETTSTFFQLGKGSLGPIEWNDHLTHVADPPGSGTIAGLAGNEVLARCDAVVFDVAHRTLWLEGTCDRSVPERRAGWRFEKKVDPANPERPWIVGSLWPGGAAERAGVRIGDRVLEVGGKPATKDIASIWAIEQQAAGTKVPVVVSRADAPKDRIRLVVELRSPAVGP